MALFLNGAGKLERGEVWLARSTRCVDDRDLGLPPSTCTWRRRTHLRRTSARRWHRSRVCRLGARGWAHEVEEASLCSPSARAPRSTRCDPILHPWTLDPGKQRMGCRLQSRAHDSLGCDRRLKHPGMAPRFATAAHSVVAGADSAYRATAIA